MEERVPTRPARKPSRPAAPEPKLPPAPVEEIPEQEDTEEIEEAPAPKTFKEGLAKTRKEGFIARLRRVLARELAPDVVDEMEEVLLGADIGVKTTSTMLDRVRESLARRELSDGEAVLGALRSEAEDILSRVEAPEAVDANPEVVLVIGVNGTGKTTTLGKLAHQAKVDGRKVLLVAGDTFRAAAVDQLGVWAERAGVDFHRGKEEADPASVVFDGIRRAAEEGHDLVLCDTAGRLHTDKRLVEELKKVARVSGKAKEGAPHSTLLVLDATIGQNAVRQAGIFTSELGVSGIVLTKLDGTARGGVVLGIVDQLGLPVVYAGVGEKIGDLRIFSTDEFLDGLFARED